MRASTFIGLPLCTRSNSFGMATAVKVLRESGIVFGAENNTPFVDCGDVQLSEIRTDSGPENLKNFPQFIADSKRIQTAVAEVGGEELMLALGGECSICIGTLAGLKSKIGGEAGIVWIDAHGDFNTPDTTPSGYIGGMCLALACGRGPKLTGIVREGVHLLREENVVHVANRALDPEESKAMLSSRMKVYSTAKLREEGVESTVGSAALQLADRCDWIGCHLDADSIDPTIMPAVNFPAQDGLTLEETRNIVDAVQRTGKLKLFELAGYNPDLDQNQTSATKLVRLAADLFT